MHSVGLEPAKLILKGTRGPPTKPPGTPAYTNRVRYPVRYGRTVRTRYNTTTWEKHRKIVVAVWGGKACSRNVNGRMFLDEE